MRKPRLLKFDGMHPRPYFLNMINARKDWFDQLDRKSYLKEIISVRSNYSDFYTHNLALHGWEAEEFLYTDSYYFDKVASELFGSSKRLRKTKENFKNKLNPQLNRWEKAIIREYIHQYKPDVIFIREHSPIESSFWKEFSKHSLVVNRIAMNLPMGWSPTHFDLIFTTLEHYKAFFEANEIPSYLFYDGFDKRILSEITTGEKIYEVSHAGGLGKKIFHDKTELFERVSKEVNLNWWGWGKETLPADYTLHKSFKGYTTGIEMFNIYKQSRIILNDYGNIAQGIAVNQRIYEVLGIGSFLLTREADNLKKSFPSNIMVMFRDEKDCLDKIRYFLKNEKEREEIALEGQRYALEHFDYEKMMGNLSEILKQHYFRKFGSSL